MSDTNYPRLKKQRGIASVLVIIGMFLTVFALPVATKLVQQNQENRSSAAGGTTCSSFPKDIGNKTCNGSYVKTCQTTNGSTVQWVQSSSPCEHGCSGGTCKSAPTCTWSTGNWSACTNGTQTRSVTKTPSGCTGTPANKPSASQGCTITCTGYTYGEWSACNSSGRRTRSVTGTTPSGCNTSPTSSPYASEPCTYVPPAPTKCTINTSSFDIGFVFCNSAYNQVWTCKSDGTWGKSDCLQGEICPSGKTACVAKPNPINGKCITSLTAAPTSSSCVSGTFKDQPDYSGHWVWDCEGVNGGTTAHCNVATPCVPGQILVSF